MIRSTHGRLTDAGWSYRTNADRGWVIYCDPATGQWHARDEAIRLLEAKHAVPLTTRMIIAPAFH
jgi:hypothetical protein